MGALAGGVPSSGAAGLIHPALHVGAVPERRWARRRWALRLCSSFSATTWPMLCWLGAACAILASPGGPLAPVGPDHSCCPNIPFPPPAHLPQHPLSTPCPPPSTPLLSHLQSIALPVSSRCALASFLEGRGFSPAVAAWAATNLAPAAGGGPGLAWGFDLAGISDMYK